MTRSTISARFVAILALAISGVGGLAWSALADEDHSEAAAGGGSGLFIGWYTIDGGGGESASGSYLLKGTIGQPDAGTMAGDGGDGLLVLRGGFWPGVGSIVDKICPADLDADGLVGGSDLGLLLAAWGPCDDGCEYDVEADGVVDGQDLGLLLSAWGPCIPLEE